MEELLAAAAEALNAPAAMVERSAEARAKADGVSVEEVLAAWAGGAAVPAAASTETPAAPAEPAPEPVAQDPVPAPAAPIGTDHDSLVAAAAERMGMPLSMIERSAAARARAAETDVETVLREWAGVDSDEPPAAPASEAPVEAEPAPAEEPAAAEEPSAAPAPPPAPEPAAPVAAAPTAPVEPTVEVEGEIEEIITADVVDDEFEPEADAVAAGALPRWLAALFVVIPAFAIGYALFLPNGPNCGDAASLAVDPVSGLAVNCDGSEYGSVEVDLFSLGAQVYESAGCVACHGPNGAGVGAFPGFTAGALLETFPQDACSAQIEWVSLGTTGWPDATYGATAKPVGGSGGVMPGFGASLTPEEIAAVSLFERVEFGGQDIEAATADCSPEAGAEQAALGE